MGTEELAVNVILAVIASAPQWAQAIDLSLAPTTTTPEQMAKLQAARNAAIEADAASGGPAKA